MNIWSVWRTLEPARQWDTYLQTSFLFPLPSRSPLIFITSGISFHRLSENGVRVTLRLCLVFLMRKPILGSRSNRHLVLCAFLLLTLARLRKMEGLSHLEALSCPSVSRPRVPWGHLIDFRESSCWRTVASEEKSGVMTTLKVRNV